MNALEKMKLSAIRYGGVRQVHHKKVKLFRVKLEPVGRVPNTKEKKVDRSRDGIDPIAAKYGKRK